MTEFSREDKLRSAVFTGVDLRDARFVESDLSRVVMRGVEIAGADIDAPWLVHGGTLLVNGVNVIDYVESELNKRFPGRDLRRPTDPDSLRTAWAALEQAWTTALDRVGAMPDGTVDISVAGEWSFASTLRHLVFATDLWLGDTVLGLDQPYSPIGQRHDDSDPGPATGDDSPTYDEILRVRAERLTLVRDFIAGVTAAELAEQHQNPHDPDYPETTLSCLLVILEEEWEHLRFATRDLDAIESGAAAAQA